MFRPTCGRHHACFELNRWIVQWNTYSVGSHWVYSGWMIKLHFKFILRRFDAYNCVFFQYASVLHTVFQVQASSVQCVISSFRRNVHGICALMEYYATYSDISILTFRDNLLVPSSRAKLSNDFNSICIAHWTFCTILLALIMMMMMMPAYVVWKESSRTHRGKSATYLIV